MTESDELRRYFDDLGKRWAAAASERGVEIAPPELGSDMATELLELARVAAHTHERIYAPLACFTAGVAYARLLASRPDLSDQAAVDFLRGIREQLEA